MTPNLNPSNPSQAQPVSIPFGAFGAVAGLTVLNVLVHYSGIPSSWRIVLHLLLALGQATLIGVFSMHLVSERRMVFWVMGFTVFFCIILFGLSLLGRMDVIHF